ncbi:MAG: hypothetical protein V1774_01680 [Candidatus Eisenbacteria bacterium]
MKLAASYFGNRILRHVRDDMEQLHARGFTRVVHTFSENDLAFYRGTMRDIVRVSQECGLEVLLDPWGVARVFGGEAYSGWLLENPDLFQRGASGRLLGGACLNHPALRPRLYEWIEAAAETDAGWIFWDEPHWVPRGPRNPDGETCVCAHCKRRMAELIPGTDPPMTDTAVMARMRGQAVVDLLADLTRHAAGLGLRSSLCALPQGLLDQPPVEWDRLLAAAQVHEFGTDPYWQAFGVNDPRERRRFIDEHAGAAVSACRRAGIASMLWIQAFRITGDREQDLLAGTRELLRHAPGTVALWGYEACAHMSALACQRPAEVWNALIEVIRSGGVDGSP